MLNLKGISGKLIPAMLALSCVFLAVVDGRLLEQNKELAKLATAKVRSEQLLPGDKVPPLLGFDVRGGRLKFEYGPRKRETLLLVFSPHCRACALNWHAWQEVLAVVNRKVLRVALVDPTASVGVNFLEAHGLAGTTVFAQVDPDLWLAYKLGLTPETILISPRGRVDGLWVGVLRPDRLKELVERINALQASLGNEAMPRVWRRVGMTPYRVSGWLPRLIGRLVLD